MVLVNLLKSVFFMPYLAAMVEIISEYITFRNLPIQDTVEGTMNVVLESLAKEPENKISGEFAEELVSSCAVVLNGLRRIKDPVRLFRNLGSAFERRGYCIYTKTVANAFKGI